jgi:hypothetical protein
MSYQTRTSITSPSGASSPTHNKAAAPSREANEDYTLIVKSDHIVSVLKAIDALLHDKPLECIRQRELLELLEEDGVQFDDGERAEWGCRGAERGVEGSYRYTCVSGMSFVVNFGNYFRC